MDLTCGHASLDPPGIRLGPFRAPSSPPETPVPIYNNPFPLHTLCDVWYQEMRITAVNNDIALVKIRKQ